MDGLNLLIIIDNSSSEKKHVKLLEKYKVKFKAVTHGVGTASLSLLHYFGLDDIEKIIIFSVVPKDMCNEIFENMLVKNGMNKPGRGIAFTIPLSSSPKYMLDAYNKSVGDRKMNENIDMHLIITIANDGYADIVMNAAKKAGATGGTTINGRGLETDKATKVFGILIEPEKDIVLILAPANKKKEIMDEIIDSCGLKTSGAGICFSLPVDSAIGINKEF